eukprot:comp21995_c2_seq1/m.31813 comp21995_c2_seq1/g.31813  ORF comp21995_c2_seq1/g.31813 comp21995_c2_seq1/m.31813 type:complete len:577 (-) comp21995_c2_seq1:31-1761(-)
MGTSADEMVFEHHARTRREQEDIDLRSLVQKMASEVSDVPTPDSFSPEFLPWFQPVEKKEQLVEKGLHNDAGEQGKRPHPPVVDLTSSPNPAPKKARLSPASHSSPPRIITQNQTPSLPPKGDITLNTSTNRNITPTLTPNQKITLTSTSNQNITVTSTPNQNITPTLTPNQNITVTSTLIQNITPILTPNPPNQNITLGSTPKQNITLIPTPNLNIALPTTQPVSTKTALSDPAWEIITHATPVPETTSGLTTTTKPKEPPSLVDRIRLIFDTTDQSKHEIIPTEGQSLAEYVSEVFTKNTGHPVATLLCLNDAIEISVLNYGGNWPAQTVGRELSSGEGEIVKFAQKIREFSDFLNSLVQGGRLPPSSASELLNHVTSGVVSSNPIGSTSSQWEWTKNALRVYLYPGISKDLAVSRLGALFKSLSCEWALKARAELVSQHQAGTLMWGGSMPTPTLETEPWLSWLKSVGICGESSINRSSAADKVSPSCLSVTQSMFSPADTPADILPETWESVTTYVWRFLAKTNGHMSARTLVCFYNAKAILELMFGENSYVWLAGRKGFVFTGEEPCGFAI